MRKLTGLVAVALLLAACNGSAGPVINSAATSTTADDNTFPSCEDVPAIAADPSLYRNDPKYVGNEMPIEEVEAWATGYDSYAGIWVDREQNGWVTVAFTDDVAARQDEIRQRFPDDGVVAVHVEMSERDLSSLQNRVHEELEGIVEIQGSWTQINHGVVGLFVGVLSDEAMSALEDRFDGEPICVDGIDPEEATAPGPQPAGGEGWRLLVDERGVGHPYRTGIAWDEASLTDLFVAIDIVPVDVQVDFDDEVVIWFGAVYGSSCPDLRLDDVNVKGPMVHAHIVNTSNEFACTDDANPHTYLVAVERDRLPAPPFFIQLTENEPPGGVPEERTLVTADLRPRGSTADPGEVGLDPELLGQGPRPDSSGAVIEPGFPWTYEIDLSCGMENLGEINSYHWETNGPLPPSWLDATQGSDTVVVEILLSEGDPPTIEVTFEDETVVYQPVDSRDCG